jgi:hypothetical protein
MRAVAAQIQSPVAANGPVDLDLGKIRTIPLTLPEIIAATSRCMKLVFHALLVASVFVGADFYVNDGAETRKVLFHVQTASMWNTAKVQAYHAGATIRQQAHSARPQLALVD